MLIFPINSAHSFIIFVCICSILMEIDKNKTATDQRDLKKTRKELPKIKSKMTNQSVKMNALLGKRKVHNTRFANRCEQMIAIYHWP